MAKRRNNTFEVFRIPKESIGDLNQKFSFCPDRLDDEQLMLNESLEQTKNGDVALYVLVNTKTKEYIGVLSVCFWTIECNTMLYISLIFVDNSHRNKRYRLGGKVQKASTYLLRDVCIGILCSIDRQVPLNTIFLQPINENVSKAYQKIGYVAFGDDDTYLMLKV